MKILIAHQEKKMKKTLFIVILVMLLVTLACGSSDTTATEDTTVGNEVITEAPVEANETEEPSEVASSPWYLEEFDTNLDNWNELYFTQASDTEYENETNVYLDDGGVWFDINLEDTYIYLFNENYTYDDVSIELEVENTGPHNSQYINLVCRYTPDEGWYEFSVAASGMVQLWRYSFDDGYILIEEGGSTAINQGNATNDFKMTCVGNELSLFINGKQWRKAFTDSNYRKGFIGLSAGSMNVFPIQVFFNWVEVTEP
jgi:hypothetical protein